jgi:hypothetical protein
MTVAGATRGQLKRSTEWLGEEMTAKVVEKRDGGRQERVKNRSL